MSDLGEVRKARVRTNFDRLAPQCDAVGPACFAYFGRRLVDEVGIESGHRVLDVACGRGAVLVPVAERVKPGDVVAIDLAEEMVRATNAEAQRRGLGAPARVMDAERLALPDVTSSRVLCGFGLPRGRSM